MDQNFALSKLTVKSGNFTSLGNFHVYGISFLCSHNIIQFFNQTSNNFLIFNNPIIFLLASDTTVKLRNNCITLLQIDWVLCMYVLNGAGMDSEFTIIIFCY